MKKVLMSAVMALALSFVWSAEELQTLGLPTIDDIRVDVLVSSHWGQKTDTGYSNTGNPCFNYATPNHYPSGCSATPMAQLCWYWRYPASIKSATSRCKVDGDEVSLAYGGKYDYDAMPAVTTGGVDEPARAAIGKLTFDCAASLHSWFTSGSTFAFGMFSFVQLREVFGYQSAVGYVPIKSCSPFPALENAIVANLDAGCPVIVTLYASSNKNVHQALVDGYGFHGGRLYFHFNMGWCNVRGDDAWYELDKSVGGSGSTAYLFDKIDGLIYNIFPDATGDVLSGRVLDENGKPVAGAVVQASRSGKTVDSVQTDANGIYAFVLAGGATYKVSCEGKSISVALPESVSAKRMVTSKKEGVIWENPFEPAFNVEGTLGGSAGNDIVLSGGVEPGPDPEPDPDPEPEPSALGPFNPTKAGKGEYPYSGAVYDEAGNPRGTMMVKFTKPAKNGTSKISATLKLLDGKSYSLAATPVPVSETESAVVSDKPIKKLGTLVALEVGAKGFVAAITAADGTKLVAETTDLSKGLSEGVYKFSVSGLPAEINGLPVVEEMLPNGVEVPINAKGKITLAKAATLKFVKVKGSKPAVYELVFDTSKGKTNLPGLKLTSNAKTATLKGSFSAYTINEAKHKVTKTTFTVNAMVIDGRAVGTATCKKPAITCPVVLEK